MPQPDDHSNQTESHYCYIKLRFQLAFSFEFFQRLTDEVHVRTFSLIHLAALSWREAGNFIGNDGNGIETLTCTAAHNQLSVSDDDRLQSLFGVSDLPGRSNHKLVNGIHAIIDDRKEQVLFSAGNEMIDSGLGNADGVSDVAHRSCV